MPVGELVEARRAILQYHSTTEDVGRAIVAGGFRLPTLPEYAKTHRYEIPTLSVSDEPRWASSYYPQGVMLEITMDPRAKPLKRSHRRSTRRGENLEQSVNRWIRETEAKGRKWVHVGPGIQGTVGNQILDLSAIQSVRVIGPAQGPYESLDEAFSLKAADRRVLDAFLSRKEATGKRMYTDGRTLTLDWFMGGPFAEWAGTTLRLRRAPGTRSENTVLRYIEKNSRTKAVVPVGGSLRVEHVHLGGYGDQDNWRAIAREGSTVVGVSDYSTHNGRVSIQGIEVEKGERRRGVASAIYQAIKKKQGVSVIPASTLTDLGSAWRKGLGEDALDERRGEWLFHTTNPMDARKILKQGRILSRPFTSLSLTATWSGAVVFVFNKAKMRDRFMPVEYTREWAFAHPEHASYIAGMPETPFGEGGTASKFAGYSHEREWISKSGDDYAITLKPGDLDRILVVAPVSTDVEVQGIAAALHPHQAKEMLAKLPRATAVRVNLMTDMKALAKSSGLLKPLDVMWRDRGRNVKTKEKEKLKSLKAMSKDKHGLNFVDFLIDTLTSKKFKGKFKAGVAAGESVEEALVERRGDWLFHTTSFDALPKIVRSQELQGNDFVSFSREPWSFDITGADVVLVFDKAAIRKKVLPVKYTEQWYDRWPEHAAYIAGEGWREQYTQPDWLYEPPPGLDPEEEEFWEPDEADVEAAYRDAELQSFLHKNLEREWITRRPGSMRFKPAELDRVLVLDRTKVPAVRKMMAGVLAPELVMAKGRKRMPESVSELLDERRGQWLFHTTKLQYLSKIASRERLEGFPYVSMSVNPVVNTTISGRDVVLVFRRNRNMEIQLEEVEYTRAWVEDNLERGAYIIGLSGLEAVRDMYKYQEAIERQAEKEGIERDSEDWYVFVGDIDVDEAALADVITDSITMHKAEREWISDDETVVFDPEDLDRVLVVDKQQVPKVRETLKGIVKPGNVMAMSRRQVRRQESLDEGKAIGTLLMKGNVEERDRPLRFTPPETIKAAIRRAGSNSGRAIQRVYQEARTALRPVIDRLAAGDLALEDAQLRSAVAFRRVYERMRQIGRRASGLQELAADSTLYREEEKWFRSAVREEIRYWNTFLEEVDNGTARNIGQRFNAYIDALRFMYEATRIATMPDNVLLHWMGPRDERLCEGCAYMLEMSPFTKDNIPAVPRDGMTNCLTHCRHHIVVRVANDLNEVVRRRQQLPRRDRMVRALKERLRRSGRALARPNATRARNPFKGSRITAPVSKPI